MKDNEDWVSVAETIHAPQAVSWRDMLLDASITVIVDPPPVENDPYPMVMATTATTFNLFVQAADREAALEVLKAMGTEVGGAEEEPE